MTLTSLFEKIQVARYICEKTFTCFILNNGNFRPRAIKTYSTTICRREKLKIMNTVVGFEQGTGFFGGSYNIHIYSSSGVVGAAEGHTTDHKIERTVQLRLARSAEVNKKSSNRTRQLPELMSGRLYYYLFCLVVARIRFVQTILSRAAFFVFRNGRKTVPTQVAIRGFWCPGSAGGVVVIGSLLYRARGIPVYAAGPLMKFVPAPSLSRDAGKSPSIYIYIYIYII